MSAQWTWHGGGLHAARAHFGDGDLPWLDLSTGINPHAWPGVEVLDIDWRRLPDEADLRDLEIAAAEYFGTDPDHVCALPGTEIGLRLAGTMLKGQARYLAPSYRTHREMFEDARPIALEDMAMADDGLLLLANPNNPDGRTIEPSQLVDLLDGRRDVCWLLVDEAFADVDPSLSLAPFVRDDRSLLVFRSFGKFFGLAGVRLGFVLGPRSMMSSFREKLGAWPVSSAALAIGRAAYRDRAWSAAMRGQLAREKDAVDAMLDRCGYRAMGRCPLFRLIEVENAKAMFERLARRAILTRPFDDHPHWLRIGLPGSAEALARLEAALRDG
jgi:cobalamin biosynthetic protein CobC